MPGADFIVRCSQKVRLGSLNVAFHSNEASFSELHYFPRSVHLQRDAPVDYIVNCCNISIDGPWPIEAIQSATDRTYRGGRFASGYYLTDHFGLPAHLVTRGRELWIYAQEFKQILWPFVVKYLLTVHSIEVGSLHLKAAAVELNGAATLLVGRGGTGKTVMLTQMCIAGGARFLANTHILVRGTTLTPVLSAMRIRNDRVFGPLIVARGLPPAVKNGDYLADPCTDLGWSVGSARQVQNILLLDYQGPTRRMIKEVQREILYDYMENFSLAVNIYGLREDVLDYLQADVEQFSVEWSLMKSRLRELVDRCRCYHVSCDATDPHNLQSICSLLA